MAEAQLKIPTEAAAAPKIQNVTFWRLNPPFEGLFWNMMMNVKGVNSVGGINWSASNSVTRSVLARGGQAAHSQGLSGIVNNCSTLPPLRDPREHSWNRNNRIGVAPISGDQSN